MAKLFERTSTTITISEFYDNVQLQKYCFNISYQRKSGVWSEDKKSFLIDSIFKNYPIPAIFLRPSVDTQTGKTIYDVVDGKQRLEAIIDFIENKIPLTTYFADDSFIDAENVPQANRISGLTFEQIKEENEAFSDYIKQFWTYRLNVEYLYEEDQELIASVFDRLNRNGEPLTAQELRNAKYADSPILMAVKELREEVFWTNKCSRLKSVRMEDEEFVSELLFTILEGKIVDSKRLDALYEKYKNNEDAIQQAKYKYSRIITFLKELDLDYKSIKKLYWTTHLYTLFTIGMKLYEKIDARCLRNPITQFYTIYFSGEFSSDSSFAMYKDAASSRTKSESSRRKRLEALLNYIEKNQ